MTPHEEKSTLFFAITCLSAGTLFLLFGGDNLEKPATLLLWLGAVVALVRLGCVFLSRKSRKLKHLRPYSQATAETDAYLAHRCLGFGECRSQNAKCRITSSCAAYRQRKKENHLRKSQVVLFTGETKAERKIIILHFYKSQLPAQEYKNRCPEMKQRSL